MSLHSNKNTYIDGVAPHNQKSWQLWDCRDLGGISKLVHVLLEEYQYE